MVAEFHQAAGHPVRKEPTIDIPFKEQSLRYNLIKEELEEYLQAIADADLVAVADALTDILYVVIGSFLTFGLDPGPLMEEVHRSNMTKFGPGHSKRADGKLIKSPLYEAPDIARVIRELRGEEPPVARRVTVGPVDALECPQCGQTVFGIEGRKDAICKTCGHKFACCEGVIG